MYAQRCATNKMFLGGKGNIPKSSFLSPANKYGQRSFSASSLSSSSLHTSKPLPGSLREQIRLDAFKKNMAESKLNKSSLHRTALKVDSESSGIFRSDPRSEIRDLQRQIAVIREQNFQLKQQRSSDMLLITKQNQLLGRLQREIDELKDYHQGQSQHQCECYLIDQYLETIKGLQMKVSHLQQEKKEYKSQIRDLVIKQEQLKVIIEEQQSKKERDRSKERERERDRKYQEEKVHKEKKKMETRELARVQERRERAKSPGEGVMRYMQYLKNVRNRQIDQIENILKE